jgi:hypothetical protein
MTFPREKNTKSPHEIFSPRGENKTPSTQKKVGKSSDFLGLSVGTLWGVIGYYWNYRGPFSL